MITINLEKIKESIFIKLKSYYPNYFLYFEDVYQGLEKPCFILNIVEYRAKKAMNSKLDKKIYFDLVCKIESMNKTRLYALYEELKEIFNVICILDKGSSIKLLVNDYDFSIVENDGHFFFSCNFQDELLEETGIMEYLFLEGDFFE